MTSLLHQAKRRTFWQVVLKKMGHSFRPLLAHDVLEALQQSARLRSVGLRAGHSGARRALGDLCDQAKGPSQSAGRGTFPTRCHKRRTRKADRDPSEPSLSARRLSSSLSVTVMAKVGAAVNIHVRSWRAGWHAFRALPPPTVISVFFTENKRILSARAVFRDCGCSTHTATMGIRAATQ